MKTTTWERWWFDPRGLWSGSLWWLLEFLGICVLAAFVPVFLLVWLFVWLVVRAFISLFQRTKTTIIAVKTASLGQTQDAYRSPKLEEAIVIEAKQNGEAQLPLRLVASSLLGFCHKVDGDWSRIFAVVHEEYKERSISLLGGVPSVYAQPLIEWLAAQTSSITLEQDLP